MAKKQKSLVQRDDDSLFEILRILVFVQVTIAVISAIEAMLVGAFIGSIGTGILTLIGAVITVFLYIGLGKRKVRSRKWLLRFQVGWIVLGTIDLLLAIFLARRLLEPVPFLTRFILPYAIFRILRKPAIKAEFGLVPAPDSAEEEVSDRVPAMA